MLCAVIVCTFDTPIDQNEQTLITIPVSLLSFLSPSITNLFHNSTPFPPNQKPFNSRSFGDEFGAAVVSDLKLFGIACAIIAIYLIINISNWSRPCYTTNFAIAGACLLVVGLSYAAGTS